MTEYKAKPGGEKFEILERDKKGRMVTFKAKGEHAIQVKLLVLIDWLLVDIREFNKRNNRLTWVLIILTGSIVALTIMQYCEYYG